MASASSGAWVNPDGLKVPFGNYYKTPSNFVNRPRELKANGLIKQIVIDYDLPKLGADGVSYTTDLDNDGVVDGFTTGDVYLPANASVLRVTAVASVAAAGGTSITLGTFTLAGAAISATSLITATEGVVANLNTVGGRTYGAGALVATSVDTAGVGTADAYIALTAAGTFTAGKGRILIEYIDPLGDL
jgi:DNA-binding Lrp family transcriptional regulator